MKSFENLLIPVSPEDPCGEDISYLPEYLELDSLIRGKSETQFSEAVKPDWKAIEDRCVDLLTRSKNLQVATLLCLSALQTDGHPGAAEGLNFLDLLIQRYWESLHPRLDPHDNLDPLERLNILSALSAPRGTFGDIYQFLERLREAPLTNSPVLGRLSFNDVSPAVVEGKSPAPSLDQAQVDAAFRDTPPGELAAIRDAVRISAKAARSIADFLNGIPGAEKGPSFSPLTQQIAEIERLISSHLPEPVEQTTTTDVEADSPIRDAASPSGAIQSRADVVATLDRLCNYYAANEPSSPVPLLLQRAKRLVHSDFLQIVAELAPDALGQARSATGITTP